MLAAIVLSLQMDGRDAFHFMDEPIPPQPQPARNPPHPSSQASANSAFSAQAHCNATDSAFSETSAPAEDFGDYGFAPARAARGSRDATPAPRALASRERTRTLEVQSNPRHARSNRATPEHLPSSHSQTSVAPVVQRPPRPSKSHSSESESDGNQGMRMRHAHAPVLTSAVSQRGSERRSLQNVNRDSIGSIPGASKSSASTPPPPSVLPVRPRSSLGSSVVAPGDLMSTAHSAPSLRHRSATPDSVLMTSWDKSMSPPHSMDDTMNRCAACVGSRCHEFH